MEASGAVSGRAVGNVLIVGDGDFSFSAALATTSSLDGLVATTLDTADEVRWACRQGNEVGGVVAAAGEIYSCGREHQYCARSGGDSPAASAAAYSCWPSVLPVLHIAAAIGATSAAA